MKLRNIYLLTFLFAFFVRASLIYFTPEKNKMIDLMIYRDSGQLVVNGINPYSYNDQKDLRMKLRLDNDCFNEHVSQSQSSWNYYAGSNLPLATLFFGLIEYFFPSSLAFRYIFAFFDSFLAVLLLSIVIKKWKFTSSSFFNETSKKKLRYYFPLLIGLCLGAISPVLLLNGTVNPEHKGIGLLLIISAIYFTDNHDKIFNILVSPILLGFSISFIGLGIFIVPFCFYNIYKANGLNYLVVYSFVAFISCIVWILPFFPEIITMMDNRFNHATDIPGHGSMYVIFSKIMPNKIVLYLRNLLTFLFFSIIILGIFKKRLKFEILSASLIFVFTCVYLLKGSMDRMNIAVITVIILLLYSKFYRMTFLLTILYILHGSFTFLYAFITKNINAEFDGYFILIFSTFYFLFLCNEFGLLPKKNQTKLE